MSVCACATQVLRHCGVPYAMLHHVAIMLPRPLRDLGYKAVASMRYQLFGKDDGSTCDSTNRIFFVRFIAQFV